MKLLQFILFSLMLFGPLSVKAETENKTFELPPTLLITSLNDDELIDAILSIKGFENVKDKRLIGSPLMIRVTYSTRATAGGAATGLFSAMLSGGTLGIIPIVDNKDFVLLYEFVVQGEVIESISFSENFTQAINIYANNNRKMDKKIVDWIKATIPEFENKMKSSKAVKDLIEEYNYYFGDL